MCRGPAGCVLGAEPRGRRGCRAVPGQVGRAPERGELRQLKLENRRAKVLVNRGDLERGVERDGRARFAAAAPELLGAAVSSRPSVGLRTVLKSG